MAKLKNTNIQQSGIIQMPLGNTSSRPSTEKNGFLRFNTDTNQVENYIASWKSGVLRPQKGSTPASAVSNTSELEAAGIVSSGNFWFNSAFGPKLVFCTVDSGTVFANFRMQNNTYNYLWLSKREPAGTTANNASTNTIRALPGDMYLWNQYTDPRDSNIRFYERYLDSENETGTVFYENPDTGSTYSTDFIESISSRITDSPDRMLSHADDQDNCDLMGEVYINSTGDPQYRTTPGGGSVDFRFVEYQLSNGQLTISRQDNTRSTTDPEDPRYFMPTQWEIGDFDDDACSGGSDTWGWGYNNLNLRVKF